jgi:periplasmic divalent cation tolerance protein
VADPDQPTRETPAVSLVLTTAPSAEVAESLVGQLVEERLIACGNLVPGLLSIYRWQDEIAREPEVLVLMKTPTGRVSALFDRLAALHPYDVPEMIAVPVDAASRAYAEWVIECVQPSDARRGTS